MANVNKTSQNEKAAEEQTDNLIEQMLAINVGRADYYRRLSSFYFKELTQAQLDALASQDFTSSNGGDELIATGYADIHSYLKKRNSATRQDLAVDYAHTFLAAGNYETYAATPFESVFVSEAGLLMQEPRDEVYKMYCEAHVQPDESLHVPEDHVSFEFQFMAHLIEKLNCEIEKHNWDEALRVAKTIEEFHKNHQLNWIDDLCDAIDDTCATRFYRGVAKITRGFVHMDTDVIADELEVLQDFAA